MIEYRLSHSLSNNRELLLPHLICYCSVRPTVPRLTSGPGDGVNRVGEDGAGDYIHNKYGRNQNVSGLVQCADVVLSCESIT